MIINNIKFRIADNKDIDTLVKIDANNSSWNKNSFEHELKTNFSTIHVAEIKKEIVAYSVIWKVIDEIQLNKIAVIDKYKRKGIASQLINYIIELYKHNHKTILLEVNEKNLPAIKLYESLNFQITGRRKKYYKDDDAILMERTIQ